MATEIVALRRVSVYRTTDGTNHDSRKDAERHQAKLNLAAWLAEALGLDVEGADDGASRMAADADKLTRLLRSAAKDAA